MKLKPPQEIGKYKPSFVEARDLNEAYFMLLSDCWNYGYAYEVTEGSNKGTKRLELCMAAGIIQFPHTRPLAPIMPEGISPTTTDEKIEQYFAEYLMDHTVNSNEEYKYSEWINGHWKKGINFKNKFGISEYHKESQLDWCIRHFKEKGLGNNHCFITVGDPTMNFNYDIPYSNETERRTSPCLRGLDIKVKGNKVILGVIYRSWDLFAGFPENMGGFALLNQYIANELEIEAGPLTFYSQGLHCYDYQLKSVMAFLNV